VTDTTIKTRTLGSIADEMGGTIRTGPFGSQLHESDYTEEGVPVIMPKDIVDGKVSTATIARIPAFQAERLAYHKVYIGDIVYGRRGDIGRCALITASEAGWLCGTGCLRISLGDKIIDPEFLYYYLRQAEVVKWITNQAIGATFANLNTEILRNVEVSYPSLRG
jgi:type I restriction enzyme S subunit